MGGDPYKLYNGEGHPQSWGVSPPIVHELMYYNLMYNGGSTLFTIVRGGLFNHVLTYFFIPQNSFSAYKGFLPVPEAIGELSRLSTTSGRPSPEHPASFFAVCMHELCMAPSPVSAIMASFEIYYSK